MTAPIHCLLCPEVAALSDFADHVRLIHPDREAVATWPDGGVLVDDLTFTSSDFGGTR